MMCRLKERMRAGETVLGTWVTIGHTDVADMMEAAGFDWVVFDMEHAPLGPESVGRMVQVLDPQKVCPLVRVGAVEMPPVKTVLDLGAHGIVFPLVNSAADARRAVSFAKYPPDGVRGVAPRKAADYGITFADYLRTANEQTVVIVQIETRDAVANLDEILGAKGVDVAFVGPSDLTMSLGLVDDRKNPKVIDIMKRVVKECAGHGKTPGVLAATPDEAQAAVKLGFKFVGLGSDTRFMLSGAKDFLRAARA